MRMSMYASRSPGCLKFSSMQYFLKFLTGMRDQAHDVAITLARRPEGADVAAVTERTVEAADDKADTCRAADRILTADVNTERLIRCHLAEPWFEIVEQA